MSPDDTFAGLLASLEFLADVLPWPEGVEALMAARGHGCDVTGAEALATVGGYLVAVGNRLTDTGKAVGNAVLLERGEYLRAQGTLLVILSEADNDEALQVALQGLTTGQGGEA